MSEEYKHVEVCAKCKRPRSESKCDDGYLHTNGQVLEPEDYPKLFAALLGTGIEKTSKVYEHKLNIEDVKAAALSVQKMEEKPMPRGLGWFTKVMGRLGWHRKYEIIVLDSSRFGMKNFIQPKV